MQVLSSSQTKVSGRGNHPEITHILRTCYVTAGGSSAGRRAWPHQHLLYTHLSLVVHLVIPFKAILIHGSVPDNFGAGICVPLIKDKTGNVNDITNTKYRIITLSQIIAKLFEMVVMLAYT